VGEFRVLTLRETPAYGKAENPDNSADYWRKHIATDPRHNSDVESLVCLVLNTRRDVMGIFWSPPACWTQFFATLAKFTARPLWPTLPRSSSCTTTPAGTRPQARQTSR